MSETVPVRKRNNTKNKSNFYITALLFLLLIERIIVFFELGAEYVSNSDDVAYMRSGIVFANTGVISIWTDCHTARIMPGMPVLLGIFSLIFGEGTGYLVALKIMWIAMGVLTAFVAYKTVGVFLPQNYGLFAAAAFLLPNIAWANNLILTETPYTLALCCCLYYTFCMGESMERKYFVGFVLSFMLGLMFRANILSMAVFTPVYIFAVRRKCCGKILLKRAIIFICTMLCFFVPWTIRNYVYYDAFLPLGYGAGHPSYLGSYQGEGWPEDEELDYYTNVELKMREEYPEYFEHPEQKPPFDEEAFKAWMSDPSYTDAPHLETDNPEHIQYLSQQQYGLMAKYRINEWAKKDLGSLLKSYLYIKPRWMLNWSWAWEEVLNVPYSALHRLSQLNAVFCGITVLLSLILKKCRKPVLFLSFVYIANVYLYSLAFVSDRYASTIMLMRYLLMGFFVYIIADAVQKIKKQKT